MAVAAFAGRRNLVSPGIRGTESAYVRIGSGWSFAAARGRERQDYSRGSTSSCGCAVRRHRCTDCRPSWRRQSMRGGSDVRSCLPHLDGDQRPKLKS
eukprot:4888176-Prymnesium_polylepis.1